MDIKDFFDTCHAREYLRSPFNLGDRTIATDGYAMISIPRDDKYEEREIPIDNSINEILGLFEKGHFGDLPELELEAPVMCWICSGTGKLTNNDCPECCCSECNGEGKVIKGGVPTKIHDIFIASTYAALLSSDPNVQIAELKERNVLLFISGEAKGAIAGWKP